jgi:hypothetical protein
MEEDERGEGGDLEESFLVGGWALGRAEENGEGAGAVPEKKEREGTVGEDESDTWAPVVSGKKRGREVGAGRSSRAGSLG